MTIVEFFDPACEACRAFHPIVKQILTQYPDDVRVVMRYTPFHGEGSELAIKVLEAARLQDVFVPVLEALAKISPPGPLTALRQRSASWRSPERRA